MVSSKVEHEHREVVFGRLHPSARAQVRSQAGPGAGLALSATPTHFLTKIPSHLFRVVMLRRLRLPLLPSLHTCRCGRRFDKFGHHRASCARAGVLGRRGFALESAIARVCREAGGRVTQNVMVRDLDLAEPQPAETDGGLRWSWMASHCSVDASSQKTPPSSALSIATVLRTRELRTSTAWFLREPDEERSGPTRNWFGREGKFVWLCWA